MSVTASAKLSGYNVSGCLIEGNLTRFVAVRVFRFPRREQFRPIRRIGGGAGWY
jgi:hypothetical protein